jgi:hypothetical protein
MGYGPYGRSWFPGRAKGFTPHRRDLFWFPLSFLSSGYREVFPGGVEWTGCRADHSQPSGTKVKNGGTIPPLPNTSSWRGAWDHFTVFKLFHVSICYRLEYMAQFAWCVFPSTWNLTIRQFMKYNNLQFKPAFIREKLHLLQSYKRCRILHRGRHQLFQGSSACSCPYRHLPSVPLHVDICRPWQIASWLTLWQSMYSLQI